MADQLKTYGNQPPPVETRELLPVDPQVTGDAQDVFRMPPVRRQASQTIACLDEIAAAIDTFDEAPIVAGGELIEQSKDCITRLDGFDTDFCERGLGRREDEVNLERKGDPVSTDSILERFGGGTTLRRA